MRKIVEVTLRAISPGINDPNTAIDCIQHLGLALGKVSKLDGRCILFQDYQKQIRVIIPQKPFEEILYLTFYQISYYGRQDISVILAIFDALILMVRTNKKIAETVNEFSDYLLEGINLQQQKQIDQKNINQKIAKLKEVCNR